MSLKVNHGLLKRVGLLLIGVQLLFCGQIYMCLFMPSVVDTWGRIFGAPSFQRVNIIALADFGVAPASVHVARDLEQGTGGLDTSTAHVAFASPALAEAARQHSQQRIFRDRYIEALPALVPAGKLSSAMRRSSCVPTPFVAVGTK